TLINTAQASPARAAALDMPEAAAANRGLFYDRTGRPRGAAELYALLATSQSASRPAPTALAGAAIDPASSPDTVSAYAAIDGGGLRALFQTDKRQGAMSEGVARLWQGRGTPSTPAASSLPHEPVRSAPTYFPRSDGTGESVAATASPAEPARVSSVSAQSVSIPASAALVNAPLPPRRPVELAAAAVRPAHILGAKLLESKPLDLSLFTTRSGQ
ncbi:lytic transglycosylase domain-containing protein, partial [Methylobacterium marchantiae]